MCGICGILAREPVCLGRTLTAMNAVQRHRGPDGEGFFIEGAKPLVWHDRLIPENAPGSCGLAHRRLAILDPEKGCQPMTSRDGSVVIVLNGEIYNFQALKKSLSSTYPFVTDCDTEVLLALYQREPDNPGQWLRSLNGIFAFAVWDRTRKRLLLARDPFGVKPLHYCMHESRFLFASEIKSLLASGFQARLNRSALHAFLNVRYVPDLQTLFDGVFRFPPGHFAWVRRGVMSEPEAFYTLPGPESRISLPRQEWCGRISRTFFQAVKSQLLSDVPVGISLSGGLDSSMNVAAADAAYQSDSAIRSGDHSLRTFSIGFNEPTDELEDAQLIAQRYRTQHHEQRLVLNPLQELAKVVYAVEEPKVNIIQGYMLAGMAGQHVKVLLSGLGGDELFAGYDIHRFCNSLGRGQAMVPGFLHEAVLSPLGKLWWRLQNASGMLKFEHYRIGGQIALSLGDRTQFYIRLRNAWDEDSGMYRRIYMHPDTFQQMPRTRSFFEKYFQEPGDYLDQVMRAEFHTKMVNDFLINEDRTTSAHGVEGRVPFLDRDLVELAFAVPPREKMVGTATKVLWKDSIREHLPHDILAKKKQGFTFSSYHQWTKDLRGAVERDLTPEWCHDTGLFNPKFISDLLEYPAHPNLRWHYFMAWMMLGVKTWMEVFHVDAS